MIIYAICLALGLIFTVISTNIAQLPPVLESLTGVKFGKLLEQVPALKKSMGKDQSPQQ